MKKECVNFQMSRGRNPNDKLTRTMKIQKSTETIRKTDGETQQQANSRLFNWGIGDGEAAKKAGRKPSWQKGEHFSQHYEDGFWIGFNK